MLTQIEYNQLPLPKKADLLWRHGQHLLNRPSPPFTVSLYLVGDFFVEAYFGESTYYEGNHELLHLFSLHTQNRRKSRSQYPFERYLDQIDLQALIRD
ncbi:hypothetical protein GCM10028803_25780 [Larkinella knui]|uniref:Uncharacterized protein n=1 Tax=Larkinella knui TaxID=2025310 RepID=A0A3P1CWR0_9BACT|nr:hypothetical protein [Larkinella knui]RRB17628.1 hypothetical protein EHT87_04925 [Larkinella knui]